MHILMFRDLLIFILLATAAAGETPLEKTLQSAATRFHLTPAEIQTAAQKAVWNEHRNAAAIALPRAQGVLAIVLLQQPGGDFLAVDVSPVEAANLGKLGLKGRRIYERVETTPLEWLPRKDGSFQIVFRTRAWSGGQRYTVTEPLIIASDGRVFWR
jgi:hypothetical protein